MAISVALAFSERASAAEQSVLAAFARLWREPERSDHTTLAAWLLSSVWREATGRSATPIPPY